jgi:dipeptidyl aminopeptidase/acylaminoacyl peptidase
MPRSGLPELDLLDPHYLVQYLAASGYAVLRVNQRGSDDFGLSWLPAKAVVGRIRASQDLISGIEHLADMGLVDRQRVCAIGQATGGYTALITAIEYPDLLRCIVGIESVFDPEVFGARPAYLTGLEMNAASPIRRVRELQAAVLLISDYGSDSAVSYETRLRRADKDVQLIEYQNARDDLSRSPHRTDMLVRIGDFLRTHLQ